MVTCAPEWPSSVMAVISVVQTGHFIEKHCSWPHGPIGKEVPGDALKCKPSVIGQGRAQWRRIRDRSFASCLNGPREFRRVALRKLQRVALHLGSLPPPFCQKRVERKERGAWFRVMHP